MKKISWESTKGQVIELEASYSEEVRNVEINCDGDIIKTGKKEVVQHATLICSVDGKVIDTSSDISFWKIIDLNMNGYKRIWGIEKVALTPDKAKEVEAFLTEVIAEGKAPEATAVEAQEIAEEKAEAVADAKEILAQSKTTRRTPSGALMTEAQAKAWKKNYNEVQNEGCEGFVPSIITQEAFNRALAIVDKADPQFFGFEDDPMVEEIAEREVKVKEIVDALYEEMESAYQAGNELNSWHVEFWLNKETLESWASGLLSQNSWTEADDDNHVHVCNIEQKDIRDCFPDYDREDWEVMEDSELADLKEQSVADFDAPKFIDDILEWAGKMPDEDNFDDNDEYREARDQWAMEKPKMWEY